MSHNSEELTDRRDTPIAAPLACQTTAKSRKSPARPSFRPARRLFLTEYGVKLVSEAL